MKTPSALELSDDQRPLHVYCDYPTVVEHIRDGCQLWNERGWRNNRGQPIRYAGQWRTLLKSCNDREVTWHHVQGHTGVPGNEAEDALARAALDGDTITPPLAPWYSAQRGERARRAVPDDRAETARPERERPTRSTSTGRIRKRNDLTFVKETKQRQRSDRARNRERRRTRGIWIATDATRGGSSSGAPRRRSLAPRTGASRSRRDANTGCGAPPRAGACVRTPAPDRSTRHADYGLCLRRWAREDIGAMGPRARSANAGPVMGRVRGGATQKGLNSACPYHHIQRKPGVLPGTARRSAGR